MRNSEDLELCGFQPCPHTSGTLRAASPPSAWPESHREPAFRAQPASDLFYKAALNANNSLFGKPLPQAVGMEKKEEEEKEQLAD